MSRFPTREPDAPTNRRDAGFTLPELLISIVISGILIVSISVAFTTVLTTQISATERLAESKDITFVQTWIPADLSSALASYDEPSDVGLLASLATMSRPDGTPLSIVPSAGALPGTTGLPGVNVITIVRPDLETSPVSYYLVAYRYHKVGGKWQISRFEIRNPGEPSQTMKTVGVAHEVPSPPVGWDPLNPTRPTFAVEVSPRNGEVLRPVAQDVKINFPSGNRFTSGGAGLSAENQLDPNGPNGVDPTSPPSRCGGRMSLLLDTSGSISPFRAQLRTAANSFINSFSGTPYTLSLNGFDTLAYGITGDGTRPGGQTNGVRAPYVSLLNGGSAVADLNTRVNNLPTQSSTNWSDGLNILFAANNGTFAGQPYGVDQPDLVVFITDGDPTRGRHPVTGAVHRFFNEDADASLRPANRDAAADQAELIAQKWQLNGTKIIGVMVGSSTPSDDSVRRLQQVVGDEEWEGSINADGTVNMANAADADLFRSSFDDLGKVLRSILIAECGGTLTLQKRIDTGGGNLVSPTSGVFNFSAPPHNRSLDRADTSSITFDYTFAAGELEKTIVVREESPGYVFLGAQCTAGGVPIDSPLLTDGTAGVSVTVGIEKAVSCLMISEPTS